MPFGGSAVRAGVGRQERRNQCQTTRVGHLPPPPHPAPPHPHSPPMHPLHRKQLHRTQPTRVPEMLFHIRGEQTVTEIGPNQPTTCFLYNFQASNDFSPFCGWEKKT